jgi:hypothetical protein
LRDGQRSARDARRECFSFEELHHQIRHVARAADVVHDADVRMIEVGEKPGFPLEALVQLRGFRHYCRQNLDGDSAIEARIAGSIHLSHPAGAERGVYYVGAEPCSLG